MQIALCPSNGVVVGVVSVTKQDSDRLTVVSTIFALGPSTLKNTCSALTGRKNKTP
jgi:hypothetical protein